ncbi:MAG: hypothetical protein LBU83_10800 [Bacteroidales bacterium]|jgi:hypothetical protein|nr:hypothetical protein [Bacteroidales bacterium]
MKNVITVLADDSVYGKNALAHAQKLAQIFDADVDEISLLEKQNLDAVLDASEEGNILCFVMPVAPSKKLAFFNPKKARKLICKSRAPVFTIGNNEPKENDYQQVVLPLDINCQDKELALWASYFPTYIQRNCPHIPKHNLLIHIVYNQYKDELLRKKVQNNVEFSTKMFDNLEVPYKLHPVTKINNIHTFGVEFAHTIGNGVLLFLMTEHFSIIDLLFGPVEHKILGNRYNIPVLCLNAREDIFVICQ